MKGCDKTSTIFGKGKGKLWNALQESAKLRRVALEFNAPNASRDRIAECGERLILALYPKTKKNDVNCLNELRYNEFEDRVASKPSDEPKNYLNSPDQRRGAAALISR